VARGTSAGERTGFADSFVVGDLASRSGTLTFLSRSARGFSEQTQ